MKFNLRKYGAHLAVIFVLALLQMSGAVSFFGVMPGLVFVFLIAAAWYGTPFFSYCVLVAGASVMFAFAYIPLFVLAGAACVYIFGWVVIRYLPWRRSITCLVSLFFGTILLYGIIGRPVSMTEYRHTILYEEVLNILAVIPIAGALATYRDRGIRL